LIANRKTKGSGSKGRKYSWT